ncbi:MAG: M20/M25/M40 family metallo-hydrolase [Roseiflexaceae bacterium]
MSPSLRSSQHQTANQFPPVAVSLIILLALLGAIWLPLALLRAPAVAPEPQSPEAFSTQRALLHVQEIAQQPHPIGSPENARVRDYLVRTLEGQGLAVEVQRDSVFRETSAGPFIAGRVENVVARLPGADNTRAVLLMAHYDSVLAGPGANDDGAGVAALLETARALRAGPTLRNDVIVLLTDGEEAGLLGATAFLQRPGVAESIGVVINLEARGSDGPVLMFETSPENGDLIQTFAEAAPVMFANSLFSEVYQRLPNDTDFTVFKRAGLSGLNFAYIDGYTRYHSVTDGLESLHVAGMQQHGQTALALARAFGARDLRDTKSPNVIYFDLFGRALVVYPNWLALPLALLLALGWLAAVVRGRGAGALSIGGVLLGALVMGLAVVLAVVLGAAAVPLLGGPQPEFAAYGDTDLPGVYLAGLAALVVAQTTGLLALARRRLGPGDLAAAALLYWVVLALVCAVIAPGVSFLFTWVPCTSLIGLWLLLAERDTEQILVRRWPALLVCALPGLLLLVPLIYLFAIALTLRLIAVALVVTVLGLGLVLPQVLTLGGRLRWRLPAASLATGAALLVLATIQNPRNEQFPAFNNVWYGLDSQTGQATWGSTDPAPDAWTQQFFPDAGTTRGLAPAFFPLSSVDHMLHPAPVLDIAPPRIEVLEDRRDGGERTVRLRVGSAREAPLLWVYIDSAGVRRVTLEQHSTAPRPDNRLVNPRIRWSVIYAAPPPEGLEMTIELAADQPMRLLVIDRTSGLPESSLAIQPRPPGVAPVPALANRFSNATLVSTAVQFTP